MSGRFMDADGAWRHYAFRFLFNIQNWLGFAKQDLGEENGYEAKRVDAPIISPSTKNILPEPAHPPTLKLPPSLLC